MQMTGAQMVLKALEDQQVDTIFGYPGGAVLPIYDELAKTKDSNHQIRHFLVRHEQVHPMLLKGMQGQVVKLE